MQTVLGHIKETSGDEFRVRENFATKTSFKYWWRELLIKRKMIIEGRNNEERAGIEIVKQTETEWWVVWKGIGMQQGHASFEKIKT